jgi:uncharacterized coiled-coil DUF342 family protein
LDRGGGSIVLLTTEEYQELLKKAVKTDKLATENEAMRAEICLLKQERDELIAKVNRQTKHLRELNQGTKRLRQAMNKAGFLCDY